MSHILIQLLISDKLDLTDNQVIDSSVQLHLGKTKPLYFFLITRNVVLVELNHYSHSISHLQVLGRSADNA